VVVGVGHVQLPGGADDDARGVGETRGSGRSTVAQAVGGDAAAGDGGDGAGQIDLPDPMVTAVGDVQVSGPVEGQALGLHQPGFGRGAAVAQMHDERRCPRHQSQDPAFVDPEDLEVGCDVELARGIHRQRPGDHVDFESRTVVRLPVAPARAAGEVAGDGGDDAGRSDLSYQRPADHEQVAGGVEDKARRALDAGVDGG
jgi:hypothetical protein